MAPKPLGTVIQGTQVFSKFHSGLETAELWAYGFSSMERSFSDDALPLHELILRSFRQREALWSLVLATYRVELTGLLSRAAKTGFEFGDANTVIDLAEQIASVARAADLSTIRKDALSLRTFASAAQDGGEQEEGKVLLAGLRLIDRILDEAKERAKAAEPSAPQVLN